MRICLIMLGKTRRAEVRALLDDYLSRLRRHCDVESVEVRDSAAAQRKLTVASPATIVLLDAAGKKYTSEEFAAWLGALRDHGTRALVFLCGDSDGFPAELRQRAQIKLSLTPLTLSHQLARVVLAEQLYRAFAILSGSPYPK